MEMVKEEIKEKMKKIKEYGNTNLEAETFTNSFNTIIKNTLNYNRNRLQIKPNVMISYS